jgi:hypothetical protein
LHFKQVNKNLIEMIWKLKINKQKWIIMSHLIIQLQTFDVQQCFDRFHSYLTSTFIQPKWGNFCVQLTKFTPYSKLFHLWLFLVIIDYSKWFWVKRRWKEPQLYINPSYLFSHNNLFIRMIFFATCYEKWLELPQ